MISLHSIIFWLLCIVQHTFRLHFDNLIIITCNDIIKTVIGITFKASVSFDHAAYTQQISTQRFRKYGYLRHFLVYSMYPINKVYGNVLSTNHTIVVMWFIGMRVCGCKFQWNRITVFLDNLINCALCTTKTQIWFGFLCIL